MVQNGKFSAGIVYLDNMLKVEDFPIFAIPTIPIFKEFIDGRPIKERTSLMLNCELYAENLKKIFIYFYILINQT